MRTREHTPVSASIAHAHIGAGSSHAVTAVGAHGVVAVDLSGDDTDVEVVLGALAAVRALAERAHVHVIGLRAADRVLLHAEEATGLLALASDLLQGEKMER